MLSYIKNLSIRNKLLLSNGFFIVLTLCLSALSAFCIFNLKAENDRLNDVLLPSVNQISELTDKYWMTRIRLLLIPIEQNPQRREELKKQVHEFSQLYFDNVNGYQDFIKNSEDKQFYDGLKIFTASERKDLNMLIPLVDQGKYQEALAWQGRYGGKQYDNFDESSEALGEFNQNLIHKNHQETSETFNVFIWIYLAANILTVIVMAALALWYANMISKPIINIQKVVQTIADGNLSSEPYFLNTKDELGALSSDINRMSKNLLTVVTDIKDNADTLVETSSELSAAATQMKSGAQEVKSLSEKSAETTEELDLNIRTVASAVEQSSANIRQVFQASEQVDQNVQMVNKASKKVSSNLKNIAQSAEEASASVNTISAAVEEMTSSLNEVARNTTQASVVAKKAELSTVSTRETIDTLGNSAKEIDNVLELIKNIASQTNLLALNATIEAASAGDAGKGFAVVANEVKELAKQSAQATEEIRMRIEEIQKNTNSATSAIFEISDIITEMNSIAATIASAVEEQTATATEISRNIVIAAEASNEVSTNVQEAAKLADEVSYQATQATQSVIQITNNLQELNVGANEISESAVKASQRASNMSESVGQVKESSIETEETANSVETSVSKLSRLANSLENVVKQFTLAS